jgi:hypothetical protein
MSSHSTPSLLRYSLLATGGCGNRYENYPGPSGRSEPRERGSKQRTTPVARPARADSLCA